MPPQSVPPYVPPDYQTRQLLGSGQTSLVYLAEHPRRGPVALKLPRAELQERPLLRRMFENEVQMTLALKHPNVVAALDGHPTGERAFLALEYCPGGTLDQLLLERGRLPLETAYRLILDVARGLEHSHGAKVLHRDIKPANVFLSEGSGPGEGLGAKLGDFGTGVYLREVTTERVGTAFYMAPEIFRGESATPKSDIYSLGILAFEVIAGVRPFAGESVGELMMAHLSGLPKGLRHLRPELPTAVGGVVSRAMAREPEKRYAGVSEFVAAFAKATGSSLAEEPGAPLVGRASRTKDAPAGGTKEDRGARGLARWFGKKKA
ncbi:MAG TPA: serine/threonine-protein kinase [Trueperaceae bacterium]